MTNLEFYKEEIKAKYKHNERLSNNTLSEDVANAIFDVWKNYSNRETDMMDWLLEEHEGSLLNDDEKECLRNVQEVFGIDIDSICKKERNGRNEYICIKYCAEFESSVIALPVFKANEKFRNLELDKKYTAEELGL